MEQEKLGGKQIEWDANPSEERKLQVQRLLPPATLIILLILATLIACSDPTPAQETVTPTSAPTPTAAPASTDAPVSTETPTERPTAAPKATPANSPTPEATNITAPPGVLAPLQPLDSRTMFSELSEAEKECIGENTERQTKYVGCLEDETLVRIFLAGYVPGPGPLSQESSECVRAAFEVIDPREVMTAGIEGNSGRAMAGSMAAFSVTMACLTDQEWEETAPQVGMGPEEREGMACLMEALGGPGNMAGAMIAAGEGDFTDLSKAGAECGLDMGPASGQAPARTPPAPTATMEASTPVSTPVTTRATPTGTPATPTPSPTQVPSGATSTPAPEPTVAPPTPQGTVTLTITVAAIPADIPDYDRGDWRHWVDADGDCQDARQEVLVKESLDEVTFETDRQCRVESGRWYGAFTGVYTSDPGDLDIDHLVPLKNAHLSGGWSWDAEMREEYANNLSDPDHLIAVTASANRSKGAKGPEEWGPPDLDYWCQYATDWTEVKARWGLTMTPYEADIVMDMLGTCEHPPDMEVEELDYLGTATGEHKPTPGVEPTEEPESSVYGSCEEAESAGEQRVQGSQGSGRGFPKAMVPSAQDGDGDGVVCEQ